MKPYLGLLFLLAAPTPTLAEGDGFDFKGIPLGSSVDAVTSKFPEYYCRTAAGGTLADTTCNLLPELRCMSEQGQSKGEACRNAVMRAMSYAGVRADISLMFYEDKLSMAHAKFNPSSFASVVSAIREKFGAPSSTKAEAITNRMGASFENQILEWNRSSTTIRVEKYTTSVDRSSVKIFVDSYFAEFDRRQAATTKQRAKDL